METDARTIDPSALSAAAQAVADAAVAHARAVAAGDGTRLARGEALQDALDGYTAVLYDDPDDGPYLFLAEEDGGVLEVEPAQSGDRVALLARLDVLVTDPDALAEEALRRLQDCCPTDEEQARRLVRDPAFAVSQLFAHGDALVEPERFPALGLELRADATQAVLLDDDDEVHLDTWAPAVALREQWLEDAGLDEGVDEDDAGLAP